MEIYLLSVRRKFCTGWGQFSEHPCDQTSGLIQCTTRYQMKDMDIIFPLIPLSFLWVQWFGYYSLSKSSIFSKSWKCWKLTNLTTKFSWEERSLLICQTTFEIFKFGFPRQSFHEKAKNQKHALVARTGVQCCCHGIKTVRKGECYYTELKNSPSYCLPACMRIACQIIAKS